MEQNTEPKIIFYIHGQLMFDEGTKNTQLGKDSFSIILGKLGIHIQKNKVGPLLDMTLKI